MKFETDIFSQFNDKWALLGAGTKENHNAMTISWGGMGTLWSKPVVTVYVRPSRHTYRFMNENEYFTVSFFPEEYRKALALMGSKSGRDMDKEAIAGLTAKGLDKSFTYEEAEITVLCRKMYSQDMDINEMPEEVARQDYPTGDVHRMFIGEVVDII